MVRMLPGIETVVQHQERQRDEPDTCRPERCPGCGKGGVHRHGHYARNAPRGEGKAFSLGSLPIPRIFCRHCRRTCSRLPSCLSPRRQYWWKRQQEVLERLLAGESICAVATTVAVGPSRHTIARWRQWLEAQSDVYGLYLRSRFADLGRTVDWRAFWSRTFDSMSLGEAMGWLDRMGVVVP